MSDRKLWLGLALGVVIGSLPVWAQDAAQQTTDQKIQQLQQQVDELQKEVKADVNGQVPGSSTADYPNGFSIRSKDGNFVLHIGADLQVDNRTYYGDGATGDVDTIVIRRARPTLFGTVYKYIDFFIRPDFGLGTTALYDAYIQLNYIPWFQIRAGKFKPPVGLERLQNDDDTDFAERGLPSLLGPQRDIGFQVGSATVFNNRLTYQLAVFDGVPDGSIGTDTAVSDHRDYAGRLFLTPFAPNNNLLHGLGLGIGAEGGNTDGEALPSYKTFGQESFFTFVSGVTAAGHRTRLDPQAYYYVGPFGLLTEYALNEESFQKSNIRRNIAFRAYQAEASYFLTGEKKSYGTPVPKRNFDPLHHGGWGAIELAVRLGDWEAESAIYNYGLVSDVTSPRHLHEWDGGVNWYLNRLFKIDLDYANTAFGGGAAASAGGNKLPEKVFITRFQINFGQFN